jgi:hypothetical protein
MTTFSGNYGEDPQEFFDRFLQCMGTKGDEFKAKHFIYYLVADSMADEWFEDLQQAEKKDWDTIKVLFYKRWLNEDISIKEALAANKENEHRPTPTPTHVVTDPDATQTNLPAIPTLVTTSQVLTNAEREKGTVVASSVAVSIQMSAVATENVHTTATVDIPVQNDLLSLNNDNAGPVIVKTDTVAPNVVPQLLPPLPALNHDATPSKTTQRNPTSPGTTAPTVAKPPGQPPDVATSTPMMPNRHLSPSTTTASLDPKPTSPLNSNKTRPFLPNTSPSPPHIFPNEPISPQPPPNTSTTPLNTSTTPTTLKTTLERPGFTQNQPKTPVFNQNHAKSPKSLNLHENATDFRGITTNGTPPRPATSYDEKTAQVESPFPPFHVPPHLSVATSPLPALVGYVSSAQNSSSFENSTAYVVLEQMTPIVTIYEPSTPTFNTLTPKNMTTREFGQKPRKPPEITPIPNIWQLIIIPDIPSSGKDPPSSSHFNLHSTSKNRLVFGPFFLSVYLFCFHIPPTKFIHVSFLFLLFLFCLFCFTGDEGVATLEGGTWSIGLWPSPVISNYIQPIM